MPKNENTDPDYYQLHDEDTPLDAIYDVPFAGRFRDLFSLDAWLRIALFLAGILLLVSPFLIASAARFAPALLLLGFLSTLTPLLWQYLAIAINTNDAKDPNTFGYTLRKTGKARFAAGIAMTLGVLTALAPTLLPTLLPESAAFFTANTELLFSLLGVGFAGLVAVLHALHIYTQLPDNTHFKERRQKVLEKIGISGQIAFWTLLTFSIFTLFSLELFPQLGSLLNASLDENIAHFLAENTFMGITGKGLVIGGVLSLMTIMVVLHVGHVLFQDLRQEQKCLSEEDALLAAPAAALAAPLIQGKPVAREKQEAGLAPKEAYEVKEEPGSPDKQAAILPPPLMQGKPVATKADIARYEALRAKAADAAAEAESKVLAGRRPIPGQAAYDAALTVFKNAGYEPHAAANHAKMALLCKPKEQREEKEEAKDEPENSSEAPFTTEHSESAAARPF
jgi:hypothetical protein